MKTTTTTRRSFLAALVTVTMLLGGSPAGAATREDELKKRFEERFSKLQELKTAGKIGETYLGYLEAVEKTEEKEVATLIADENKDRTELYELIAKKEGVTAEKVAERYAKRAFARAKAGEYLKGPDGKWTKKSAGGPKT